MREVAKQASLYAALAVCGSISLVSPAYACTCPYKPQVVGDGGSMPANARALFFWVPDSHKSYSAKVQITREGQTRPCTSVVEAEGPEDLQTLRLQCDLEDADEVEVIFERDRRIEARSTLGVSAAAPMPKRWANLRQRPAQRFETTAGGNIACSATSKVFGLQIPIQWRLEAQPWSDISVIGASVGDAPYRRPLASSCDRGFDTPKIRQLQIFSKAPGHNKLKRETVGLRVFVPGIGEQKEVSIALNVPEGYAHRPLPGYATVQNGQLAADLSAIDTRKPLREVHERLESCGSAKQDVSLELTVEGSTGQVVGMSVRGLEPAHTACLKRSLESLRFGRFKRTRDTIALQVMSQDTNR